MKFYLKLSICVISSALMQQALASGYHFGTQSVGAQSTANAAAAEAAACVTTCVTATISASPLTVDLA